MEIEYINNAAVGSSPVWTFNTARLYVNGPDGTEGTMQISPTMPFTNAQGVVSYHYDHLGSIDEITPYGSTSVGVTTAKQSTYYSYDAWGARRHADTWSGPVGWQARAGGRVHRSRQT